MTSPKLPRRGSQCQGLAHITPECASHIFAKELEVELQLGDLAEGPSGLVIVAEYAPFPAVRGARDADGDIWTVGRDGLLYWKADKLAFVSRLPLLRSLFLSELEEHLGGYRLSPGPEWRLKRTSLPGRMPIASVCKPRNP